MNFKGNIEIYDGSFDQHYFLDGYGTWRNLSNDSYTGEFKSGNKDGKGVYTFANGDTFEGVWINNSKEGMAKFT